MHPSHFLVRKSAIGECGWRTRPDEPLGAGQIRVQIDRVALTANNITYAAFGDAMHYWDFFPTGEEGWGCVPVWGFGVVVQSLHPGVAVGERLYGFFPMARSVVLTPTRLSAASFVDGQPHRAGLPAVYNQLTRCAADPLYDPATEDLQALLRPLFTTSWLIDDFLADNAWFRAAQGGVRPMLLLSSASSKTAYGTAFMLSQRSDVEVVGLTSPGRQAFCGELGCYARVLDYAALASLPADQPCIYVDFAGSASLRQALHTRFTRLAYSCAIGGTHVADLKAGAGALPGPRPTLFFAPAQVKKRVAEWGGEAFGQRLAQAWNRFVAVVGQPSAPWLVVSRHAGADGIASAYRRVLAGEPDARIGHMLDMRSSAD